MSWLKRLADALEAAPQRGSGYPSGPATIADIKPPTQGVERADEAPCRCGPDCCCRKER